MRLPDTIEWRTYTTDTAHGPLSIRLTLITDLTSLKHELHAAIKLDGQKIEMREIQEIRNLTDNQVIADILDLCREHANDGYHAGTDAQRQIIQLASEAMHAPITKRKAARILKAVGIYVDKNVTPPHKYGEPYVKYLHGDALKKAKVYMDKNPGKYDGYEVADQYAAIDSMETR